MSKSEFGTRLLCIAVVIVVTAAVGCGGSVSQGVGGSGQGGMAGAGGDGGESCGPGTTLCGTMCVDTNVDPAHCGSCANACAPGLSCVSGTCSLVCSGGTAACGDACVDVSSHPGHCGGCDMACGAGEVCVAGQCTVSCGGSTLLCGGTCVDVMNNSQHCGACDMACGFGQVCSQGNCGVSCFGGTIKCGNACTDIKTDAANCGSCGTACAPGFFCSNGQCGLSCFGGTTKCADACVDTQSDAANCGACGMTCGAGEACVTGQCQLACPPNTVNCNGTCTNTAFDPSHCGSCANACAAMPNGVAVCAQGVCGSTCAPTYADCNGMPVDGCEMNTDVSVGNCGACGNSCPSPPNGTPTCIAGACGVDLCYPGFGNCDNDPMNGCETNTESTNAHCGACGNACGAMDVCNGGQCVNAPKCSNQSTTDCNVTGTTLIGTSAFVDPNPPMGWTQCAGFVNTAGNDIAHNFLDNCLNTTRLRIRVFNAMGGIEEDIYVATQMSWPAWPNFNYLGGTQTTVYKTNWGITPFFTNTDGKDACLHTAAPSGTVFGTGNGSVAVIAGGNLGSEEYRINCSGAALPDRKIALYR